MSKRLFALAADLGVNSRVIIERCRKEGVPESSVSNHMSIISAGLEATIREWFGAPPTSTAPPSVVAWQPFEDLPKDWRQLADPQLGGMLELWREREAELHDQHAFATFITKLRRQWAIETGVLERLYTISDSATKALIERGLDASLVSHTDTDVSPELAIALIRDQELAINALYEAVSSQRQLSSFYIKQLHQILTAHQTHSDGVDPSGRSTSVPLLRGEWKVRPNRIETADGGIVNFCPPAQVQSEIDRLLKCHEDHNLAGVSPEVEAAWLHHRFTQIHPFEDGNGRLARCLATLVMIKAGWFPLVITRNDRTDYIAALRSADRGDLAPLVARFAQFQRKAVREAFELGGEVVRSTVRMEDTLRSIKAALGRKKEEADGRRKQSLRLADALHVMTVSHMKQVSAQLEKAIKETSTRYWAPVTSASQTSNQREYNTYQVMQAARMLGYFANTAWYHAWAKIDIRAAGRWEILVSIHGSGKGDRGYFACSAVLYPRVRAEDNPDGTRIGELSLLAPEPFEFTYLDDPVDIERQYREWLDFVVQYGLQVWESHL